MKLNILHITPDFNYACGRSYYVYLLSKYLKLNHNNVHLITNGGDSLDRLSEYNIPYSIFKTLKSKNPLSFSKTISHLRDFVYNNNIEIIHTHHRLCELIAIQTSRLIKKKKVRTVFTSLSLVNKKYNIEFRSNKIIAVSNTIKEMLTGKFGVPENKIEVISNFVDTNEINELEIPSEIAFDHNKYFKILSIGRFHYEKNFGLLLKALNILKDSSIMLFLIGEGDKHIDYKRYISNHKLNVEIITPQKNLCYYFSIADICVLPSIRDPFPNFMLQSGLHKKPFIGARVNGIAELIENGKNGSLFESGNAEELATKIKYYKENKKIALDCALNLYRDVINNYTQEFIYPKIERLYNQVLKN